MNRDGDSEPHSSIVPGAGVEWYISAPPVRPTNMGIVDRFVTGRSESEPPPVSWNDAVLQNEGASREPIEHDGTTYRCVTERSADGGWTAAFGLAADRSEQRLFLIRGGRVRATARLGHPKTCAVANDGTTVLADAGDSDDIGGRVVAFDATGSQLIERDCGSNVSGVDVTPDGRYGAAVTLKPDCETVILNLVSGRVAAVHENRQGNKYLTQFVESDDGWELYLSDKGAAEPLYAIDTDGEVAWTSERLLERPSLLDWLRPWSRS